MGDINIGAISEALNNKVDRDMRNVDTISGGDAVIEYQAPSVENNYTWYRKYKSGWVEQGGYISLNALKNKSITLPIDMTDTNYTVQVTGIYNDAINAYGNQCNARTTTSIVIKVGGYQSSDVVNASWYVCGMAAQ